MKLLVILVALFVVSCANNDALWKKFKADHGKNYRNSIEELIRFKTFNKNKKSIDQHNALFEQGKVTYKKALNQFADLTYEEFLEVIGAEPNVMVNSKKVGKPFVPKNVNIPDVVDWRAEGAVNPVINSPYAAYAGALGSTEGINKIANGELVKLSNNNLVNCLGTPGGGNVEDAFQYIVDNGINTEEDYPDSPSGKCNFQPDKVAIKLSSYQHVTETENDLQQAVAEVPVAVAIDASSELMFYSSGVLVDTTCSNSSVNLAVLNVGYGKNSDADYWIIKNSWGIYWGEQGYLRLARNQNGMCGIATQAFVPVL